MKLLALAVICVCYSFRVNAQKLSTANSEKEQTLTYLLGAKDMILVQAALRNANSAGYKVQSNKLFSRNSGNFLRISEKRIDGLGKADDNDSVICMESVGFSGEKRLMSPDGKYYLCLTDSGTVTPVASKEGRNLDRCTFYELQSRGYAVFMSKINKRWYLGITNHGKAKSAKKTHMLQRATHFLKYS